MLGGYMGYYIIVGAIGLVSMLVSNKLKSKFKFYSEVQLRNGMSGAEIAEKMLADNGITDVKVISVAGQLTDHYNPRDKTVNLSDVVYGQRHASAAPVAASKMSMWVIMGGVALMASTSIGGTVAIIGLALYAMGTIFSLITLPVEYDASNRALAWLKAENMVTPQEYDGAEDALKWAARTYLVAAIGSLATLAYFALQVFGNRR